VASLFGVQRPDGRSTKSRSWATSSTTWNPGKDRGHGTEKLFATSSGLWIGSDGTLVAGETHPGVAFFPRPK
jgi:hypothetical protein